MKYGLNEQSQMRAEFNRRRTPTPRRKFYKPSQGVEEASKGDYGAGEFERLYGGFCTVGVSGENDRCVRSELVNATGQSNVIFMSKGLKGLSYGCLTLLFFLVLAYFCLDRLLGDWGGDCHLPDEQTVRHQFDQHRPEFLRLIDMVNHDKTIHIVDKNNATSEYHKLMTSIGIQYLLVREDRSVEFTMWGCGGAIMSDHYMGVRFVPKDYLLNPKAGWQQTVVGSIDTKKLPQEKGEVASGLYVVPVEPEWYLYRLEYQE